MHPTQLVENESTVEENNGLNNGLPLCGRARDGWLKDPNLPIVIPGRYPKVHDTIDNANRTH